MFVSSGHQTSRREKRILLDSFKAAVWKPCWIQETVWVLTERRRGSPGRAFWFCVGVVAAWWSRTRPWGRCGSDPRSGSGPRRWPAPQRRGRGPATAGPNLLRRHRPRCSRCLWRCSGSPGVPPAESSPWCSKWPTRASSCTQRRNQEEVSLHRCLQRTNHTAGQDQWQDQWQKHSKNNESGIFETSTQKLRLFNIIYYFSTLWINEGPVEVGLKGPVLWPAHRLNLCSVLMLSDRTETPQCGGKNNPYG